MFVLSQSRSHKIFMNYEGKDYNFGKKPADPTLPEESRLTSSSIRKFSTMNHMI